MKKTNVKDFQVIGISVRTTNENNQAAKDIGELWNKFMSEDILDKIPNKIDHSIFSIYTDYESDHTKPYTTILGCKVSSIDEIPEGMVSKNMKGGNFAKFVAKGDLTQGVVFKAWLDIWNIELPRTYTNDYEVYGEKAQNSTDAEVDIFLALE